MKPLFEYNKEVWELCKNSGRALYSIRQQLFKTLLGEPVAHVNVVAGRAKIPGIVNKAVQRYGPEIEKPLTSLLGLHSHSGYENIAYEIWRHLSWDQMYNDQDKQSLLSREAAPTGLDAIMNEEDPAYMMFLDPQFLAWLKMEIALIDPVDLTNEVLGLGKANARQLIDMLINGLNDYDPNDKKPFVRLIEGYMLGIEARKLSPEGCQQLVNKIASRFGQAIAEDVCNWFAGRILVGRLNEVLDDDRVYYWLKTEIALLQSCS